MGMPAAVNVPPMTTCPNTGLITIEDRRRSGTDPSPPIASKPWQSSQLFAFHTTTPASTNAGLGRGRVGLGNGADRRLITGTATLPFSLNANNRAGPPGLPPSFL